MPVLETERLILRLPELIDVPRIQMLVSERDVAATTLNIPHPYPENGAVEWFERQQALAEAGNPNQTFAIILKSENQFIGSLAVRVNRDHANAELGYWIGKPYWGQGYMSEAVKRVLRYGFEELRLHRIYSNHFGHNPASGRVMQKAGMTYEGTFPQHILKWGEFVDLVHYGITRADYERA